MSSDPTSASDQDGCPRSPVSDNSKFKIQNSKLCFVCVGAGQGSRFGGDKLAEKIGDRTVFATALGALNEAVPAAPLVVVVAAQHLEMWRGLLAADFPGALCVSGGARRQDSVRAGVETAVGLGAEIVAIHDAARPLVNPRDVHNVVHGLGEADGAILAAEIADTVKLVNGNELVVETLDRGALRFALTPQVFRVASLQAAWEGVGGGGDWTDESALLEVQGMKVRSVVAQHPNPKITTRSDLRVIRALAGLVT